MGESRLRQARKVADPRPEREPALDMGPVREKLRDLTSYSSGVHPFQVDYARYLATRLNDELVPMGFIMANLIAIDELTKDYHQSEDQRVPGPFRGLVGQPTLVYNIIAMGVPGLARAVCPPDFASRVAEEWAIVAKC